MRRSYAELVSETRATEALEYVRNGRSIDAAASDVSPAELCIIHGCLRLRVTTNFCRWHEANV